MGIIVKPILVHKYIYAYPKSRLRRLMYSAWAGTKFTQTTLFKQLPRIGSMAFFADAKIENAKFQGAGSGQLAGRKVWGGQTAGAWHGEAQAPRAQKRHVCVAGESGVGLGCGVWGTVMAWRSVPTFVSEEGSRLQRDTGTS
jgi:hypothetical protein